MNKLIYIAALIFSHSFFVRLPGEEGTLLIYIDIKSMNQEKMMTTYAYVRVSTKEQKIDRQLAAIEAFEIPKKRIFYDRQSGKDFERPEYQRLMKKICPGDLLIVKSIDRLGRNYNDILAQWQYITKEKTAAWCEQNLLVLFLFL